MPIFHITGQDSFSGIERACYVDAPDEFAARRFGAGRRIINITVTAIEPWQLPDSAKLFRAKPTRADDALRDRPVRTIAAGVFLGLLAFSALVVALRVLLLVLAGAFGWGEG